MALINAYNGKNTSGGNTLVDMVDANNGIFGGASLPVVSNGYIAFTGGNGDTAGNRGRIVFTANSYQHLASDNFSILSIFKSTKNDNAFHTVFMNYDNSSATGRYGNLITNAEAMNRYCYNATLNFEGATAGYRHSKWNVLVFANSQTARLFSINNISVENTTNSSNALYTVSAVPSIGAAKKGASWIWDATMEFSNFLHFNHKLTNAEISQYNNALAGVI